MESNIFCIQIMAIALIILKLILNNVGEEKATERNEDWERQKKRSEELNLGEMCVNLRVLC